MYPIELTEEQKREIEKRKRREERKLKWTLFFSRFKKDGISPDDTRTIQEHWVGDPSRKSFYIAEPLLQDDGSAFISVTESYENGNYYYRGIVSGADNAIGFLETNVPIKEILKRPDGNTLLKEILSKKNMETKRNDYYKSIGENVEPDEYRILYVSKPSFPMGKIIQNPDGTFSYEDASADVLKRLEAEREKEKRDFAMLDKDSVFLNVGGIVVAEQSSWFNQNPKTKSISYGGINMDAFEYNYFPNDYPLKTSDNYYVYVGPLEIGKRAVQKSEKDGVLNFISPYSYDNVVFWIKDRSLIEGLHNNKDGLTLALGDIFVEHAIDNIKKTTIGNNKVIFAGGVVTDKDGICQKSYEIPATVRGVIESYFLKKEGKFNPNIKLVKDRDEDSRGEQE